MAVVLEEFSLFKGFSKSELLLIHGFVREQTFSKGDHLFLEGNPCENVFFIRSGRVKLFRTASSGREQILETLAEGDSCACNPGCENWTCFSSAEALTSGTVWVLSRKDYVQLVQSNSKIAHTLNLLFAEKLKRFSSLIEDVSLKDVRKRLIKFLLDMSDDASIPFKREEIAQRIGSARETVARYLHDLKRSGLIELGPGKITIRERAKLKNLLN